MFRITADGVTIFSDTDEDARLRLITNPKASAEIGRSGGLTFTMLPTHPSYNSIHKFKTRIEAYMGTRLIFQGRIIEDEQDIYNAKSITCEGALSYLLDSVQAPREEDYTVRSFFTSVISSHNSQVDEYKQFTIGNITIDEADEDINKYITNYESTKTLLDQFLISIYGGYLVVRRVESTNYLDYLKEYQTIGSPQELVFQSNIFDIRKKENVSNIFTKLIPVGRYPDDWEGEIPENGIMTISSVADGRNYIANNAAINKYGEITRVEQFNNPKSPAELLIAANAFMGRYLNPNPSVLTIKAFDLSLTSSGVEQFVLGSKHRILSPLHGIDITLTLISIKWDFRNPENTELVFEDPVKEKGEKSLTKPTKSLSQLLGGIDRGYGGGGGRSGTAKIYKFIKETEDTLSLIAPNIEMITAQLDILAKEMLVQTNHLLMTSQQITETETLLETKIEQTAEAFILSASELKDEVAILEGYILVEKDKITQAVIDRTDEQAVLLGSITTQGNNIVNAVGVVRGEIAIQESQVIIEKDKITQMVIDRTDERLILQGDITSQSDSIIQSVSEKDGEITTREGAISVLAGSINTTITNRENAHNTLQSNIGVEADRIVQEVTNKEDNVREISGKITSTNQKITLEVQEQDAAGRTLLSNISVAANGISRMVSERISDFATIESSIDIADSEIALAVTARENSEVALSNRIIVSEDNVGLLVQKGGVISSINVYNGAVEIRASKLSVDGVIAAKGLVTTGSIEALRGNINSLKGGGVTADHLRAGSINVPTLLDVGNKISTISANATSSLTGTTIRTDRINVTNLYLGGVSIKGKLDSKLGKTDMAYNSEKLGTFPASSFIGTAPLYTARYVTVDQLRNRIVILENWINTYPKGRRGYTGSQGGRGQVGTKGAVGRTGSPGDMGEMGFFGSRGSQGYKGSVGYKGSQGYRGSQGFRGSQGATGQIGSVGLPGAEGDRGPVGATGATGVPGYTGSKGPQGYKGSIGYKGSQGYRGSAGYKGSVGQTGDPGARGQVGDQGIPGGKGSPGDVGNTGLQPSRGAVGITGYQGSKGEKGGLGPAGTVTGPRGDVGYRGALGDRGDAWNT